MLKRLALFIPRLRALHAERNFYAASLRNLSEENKLLKSIVDAGGGDVVRREMGGVAEKLEKLVATTVRLEEEITKPVRYSEQCATTENSRTDFSGRGLFVVGHARSGTTILVDALNSSRDVYCLGEANFHRTIKGEYFSSWFNSVHRSFDNPAMKSTCLPDLPNKCGWDVLEKLMEDYKLVGEKVAFFSDVEREVRSFFAFSIKHFQRSNYICVIRHPRSVSASCIEMFMSGQITPDALEAVAISQLQTYYLILSLALSLPSVYILVHEQMSNATFDSLGNQLGVNLEGAAGFYDFEKSVSKLSLHEVIGDDEMSRPIHYYNMIGKAFNSSSLSSQNNLEIRNCLFELHAELKSMNRLPLLV
ncbi:MAG: hypothetical protein CFE40_12600 [Burkholderiales bacterium PBB1]|nr:MAG: hypothetical protein CFE40_12600 [Burkholderiales bacterium PBB1]